MTDKVPWHPVTYQTEEDLRRNTVTVADCYGPNDPHPRCRFHPMKEKDD